MREFPLHGFELYMHNDILHRGRDYYEGGAVERLDELTEGQYEAIVSGSMNYKVKVGLKEGQVVDYSCNCPYDGGICKHIIATLFHLKEVIAHKRQAVGKPKEPSVEEKVKELLKKIDHDTLKAFIIKKCLHNAEFRDSFFAAFTHINGVVPKDVYRAKIKAAISHNFNRYGYMDWEDTDTVGEIASELMETATMHIENGNYHQAIQIGIAIMEEYVAIIQDSDDSNGTIGSIIEEAFELLNNISKLDLPQPVREQLFQWSIDAHESETYEDIDCHTDLLELALNTMQTDEEAMKLKGITKKEISGDGYNTAQYVLLHFKILQQTKGDGDAWEFLMENIHIDKIREIVIERALQNNEFVEATRLVEDALLQQKDNEKWLGLHWHNWLLKIAWLQNDKQKIIVEARFLLMKDHNDREKNLELLRERINPDEWDGYLEGLIAEAKTAKSHSIETMLYVKNGLWDRLFDYVRKEPTLGTLDRYKKFLSKDYALELGQLYADAIPDYVKGCSKRSEYVSACGYLKTLKELGLVEKANALIARFKVEYKKKRSLIEELNLIGG